MEALFSCGKKKTSEEGEEEPEVAEETSSARVKAASNKIPDVALGVEAEHGPKGGSAGPHKEPRIKFSLPHGFIFAYFTWGVMCWFIFAYGILIANLSGPHDAVSFTNTWGVSYALDQASSTLPMLETAILMQAVMPIVRMYILPTPAWCASPARARRDPLPPLTDP